MKTFFKKLYNLPTWLHYIFWTMIMTTIWWVVCKHILEDGKPLVINTFHQYMALFLIGMLCAVFPAFAMYSMRSNARFWAGLEPLQERLKNATTLEELRAIRADLKIFVNKEDWNYDTMKMFVAIDTRIKYEFKA